MHEQSPFLPTLLGLLVVSYFGFELSRQRSRLREVFNVFDRDECVIAEALEGMVSRGDLTAFSPR